jgi:hypothetical protein
MFLLLAEFFGSNSDDDARKLCEGNGEYPVCDLLSQKFLKMFLVSISIFRFISISTPSTYRDIPIAKLSDISHSVWSSHLRSSLPNFTEDKAGIH